MLSARLIRLISDHCEQITERVVRQIARDSKLLNLGSLPVSELRARTRDILMNLGSWLISHETDVAHRYEQLGRQRCEEGVPLHEVVYALQVIRENMIQYVRDQGMGHSPLEIYAEEELQHAADQIFDTLIYYFVRGYEYALRDAVRRAA
jgi:hypothetical protein